MGKTGRIILFSILGFLVLTAVVFLILAPCLGYSNIVEMFKAWLKSDETVSVVKENFLNASYFLRKVI